MSVSPVIFVGAPDEVSVLKAEPAFGECVRMFEETDSLIASRAISVEKPQVVVLGRGFAVSWRGAALVNTIKSDDTLHGCQIRVLNDAGDYVRLVSRRAKVGLEPSTAVPGEPLPDNYRGSRRHRRYTVEAAVEARLDGTPTTLVDLSRSGAQVVGSRPLRPNQRTQLNIGGDDGVIGGPAVVVWAAFEPKGGAAAAYRAGIEFTDADPEALEAFCLRRCLLS